MGRWRRRPRPSSRAGPGQPGRTWIDRGASAAGPGARRPGGRAGRTARRTARLDQALCRSEPAIWRALQRRDGDRAASGDRRTRRHRTIAARLQSAGSTSAAADNDDGPAPRRRPRPVKLDDPRYGHRPPWHDVQARAHAARQSPTIALTPSVNAGRTRHPLDRDERRSGARAARCATATPTTATALPPRPSEPAPVDGPTRGAGPAHLSGEASGVPLRARRRAQRGPLLPQGARAGPAPRLPRGPVLLVGATPPTRSPARCAANPELQVVVVVPRFPGPRAGGSSGPAAAIGRERATRMRRAWPGAIGCSSATSRTTEGTPIYVHAKVCIVDDVWMMVGSDNMNRRSWTHDFGALLRSPRRDARRARATATLPGSVTAPGRSARDTRLELWREHLGRTESTGDDDLLEPDERVPGVPAHRAGARPLV